MTSPTLETLSEREQGIIDDVLRYSILTSETLRHLRFRDLSEDAVRKILSRMATDGWLVRHLLHGQEPYFLLGQPALTALGIRRSTKPLGDQARLAHYAVLVSCAMQGRELISEDEFRASFPELSEPGLSAKNHFADHTTDPPRLGWFLVDHDKLSSRLACKVGARIARIMAAKLPEFHKLVFERQFVIYVITATDGKKANLEAAIARKTRLNLDVHVEAYPEQLSDFFLVKRR